MKFDKKVELVGEALIDMRDEDLIYAYNKMADDWGCCHIFPMIEVNGVLEDLMPSELIDLGYSNDFNIQDKYFTYNDDYTECNEGWISDDDVYRMFDMSDLAQYCIDNDKDFNNEKIRKILNTEGKKNED